tara:strand:- start:227 stop:388 length:162 start_codon:yes stop_codon:yes gene_type:complete
VGRKTHYNLAFGSSTKRLAEANSGKGCYTPGLDLLLVDTPRQMCHQNPVNSLL